MKHNATSVALRKRYLRSGRVSLYLDIYSGGRRRYEYLNLYLSGGNSRIDRENDRQLLAMADAIKAKRLVELRNKRWGFEDNNTDGGQVGLYEYFDIVAKRRESREARSNFQNWLSLRRKLEFYEQRDISLADIDSRWLEGFQSHLLSELKPTTARSYYGKLRCLLRSAVNDGLLKVDPSAKVASIKARQPERCYLTADEVRALASTPCTHAMVRRAFLFACLTGLRRSDVVRLEWSNVSDNGGRTRLTFVQKKTGEQMYLDISAEASSLMGERHSEGLVFSGLPCPNNTNIQLKRWALDAGIRKNVSFHTARHTFATMLLTAGIDLYTTSKLLGHTSVAATQIYAKIVDEKKRQAVDALPSIL